MCDTRALVNLNKNDDTCIDSSHKDLQMTITHWAEQTRIGNRLVACIRTGLLYS